MNNQIIIKGAKENNLKNISVELPKYKLIAITGVSGSGKSSFVMDILQKECQRQYLESMGMITDGLNKPKVDSIIGLSPSIAVGQRTLSNNPRSTVGTYTEIHTYLRILYAKIGTRVCPNCHNKVPPSYQDVEEIDYTDTICPHCNYKLSPLTMANFSFNKTEGACSKCHGIGEIISADYSKLIDENKTIAEGGFYLWSNEVFGKHYSDTFEKCGQHYGFKFDVSKKIKDFNQLEKLVFLYGVDSPEFIKQFPNIKKPKRVMDGYVEGVITFIEAKVAQSKTKKLNSPILNSALIKTTCPECHGTRLGIIGRTTTINQKTISDICAYTMSELQNFITNIFNQSNQEITSTITSDILKKTKSIIKIGLSYLTIDRPVFTLSGGESQRLRLTSILDSALTGVLYILDEPTTGLHPQDTTLLLNAIKKLRDLGNTVIVIEHDMSFVRECDYLIDFGVGAGTLGGEVIVSGTIEEVKTNTKSKTVPYLINPSIELMNTNSEIIDYIEVTNINKHNLKNLNLKIPTNKLVCFIGVSGSGKSTLVSEVIEHEKNNIIQKFKSIIKIDQTPIGRQSRSNVATYTEVFTQIRELYAKLPEAKKNKLKPSDFSFNVKGGRCEKCEGLGVIPLDMQFLEDIEIICPVCKGKRFKKKILEVKYNNLSISDVLDSTVHQNLNHFYNNQEILKKLRTINEVGLDYLKLGQSTRTLSGGECQRLKLSKELSKGIDGKSLYLLDEPTTGLHPSDSEKLLKLLKKLIKLKNTVFVVEHNIDIISQSDYLIELGPKGGNEGGYIIAEGTPLEIAKNTNSITGSYLK